MLASAKRVERIAREWRAEGPLSDEVMPFQIENMFQELAAVTATSFMEASETGAPIATLVINPGDPDSETLRIYAAEGDFHPAELRGDHFFISARRVLRLTMGLIER